MSGTVEIWATRAEKLVCSSTGMSDCRICYDALCNSTMHCVTVWCTGRWKVYRIINGNVYVIIVVLTFGV